MRKVICSIVMMTVTFYSHVGFAGDGDIRSDSLYNLQSKWTTQDGKQIQLKDFRGRVVIISMVYLSCQYLCPTIISEIQKIDEKLDEKTKKNVHVVLVSFDPERDSVKVMKAYAKKRKLDLSRWTLMTQKNDSNIRELAALLDFKYQKQDKGEFSHSFMITVLDQEGVIKARIDGPDKDREPLIKAVQSL